MIEYDEECLFSLIFRTKGSLAGRALWFSMPSAILCLCLVWLQEYIPDLDAALGLPEFQSKAPFWSASTATLAFLLGFRTNLAWRRFWEGTSLLHQMRGEWFDSVSCCVTFSRGAVASKPAEVSNFRHTLVRLMSLCHGSALEEISGESASFDTIDPFGLDNTTLKHIKACKFDYKFNRVEVLLHMTQTVITKALADGVITIPPPILSRVYQTLSRGFVNLLNAKKIADTRFPFPWAQLMVILLALHALITPCVFASAMRSKFWAPLFTWISTFAFFYLDFVDIELENPFGNDYNDLPLVHFQDEMNSCLVMLLQGDVDLVAATDMKRAELDFRRLQEDVTREFDDVMATKSMARRVSSWVDIKDAPRPSSHSVMSRLEREEEPFSVLRSNNPELTPPPAEADDIQNGARTSYGTVDEDLDEQVDEENIKTASAIICETSENTEIVVTAGPPQITDKAQTEEEFVASDFELSGELSARITSPILSAGKQQASQRHAAGSSCPKFTEAEHSHEVSTEQSQARGSASATLKSVPLPPRRESDIRVGQTKEPLRGEPQIGERPQKQSQTREPRPKAGNAANGGGTTGLLALPLAQGSHTGAVQSHSKV